MAKKRGNKNFRAIRVSALVSLGTLADNTHVKATLLDNTDQEMYVVSADLMWTVRDHTGAEGPLIVGLSHGDYTVGEIKEWYESSGSATTADMIALEQSRRRCRDAGMFSGALSDENLNDGKPIRTTCKFSIAEGAKLDFWVRNDSGAALTTGAEVICSGKVYVKII